MVPAPAASSARSGPLIEVVWLMSPVALRRCARAMSAALRSMPSGGPGYAGTRTLRTQEAIREGEEGLAQGVMDEHTRERIASLMSMALAFSGDAGPTAAGRRSPIPSLRLSAWWPSASLIPRSPSGCSSPGEPSRHNNTHQPWNGPIVGRRSGWRLRLAHPGPRFAHAPRSSSPPASSATTRAIIPSGANYATAVAVPAAARREHPACRAHPAGPARCTIWPPSRCS
jgi:hypothetical protein